MLRLIYESWDLVSVNFAKSNFFREIWRISLITISHDTLKLSRTFALPGIVLRSYFHVPYNKTFTTPFYGKDSTASRLHSHCEEIVYFFPLSQPWSHPVVLSMGHLDFESGALSTRPLLHKTITLKLLL